MAISGISSRKSFNNNMDPRIKVCTEKSHDNKPLARIIKFSGGNDDKLDQKINIITNFFTNGNAEIGNKLFQMLLTNTFESFDKAKILYNYSLYCGEDWAKSLLEQALETLEKSKNIYVYSIESIEEEKLLKSNIYLELAKKYRNNHDIDTAIKYYTESLRKNDKNIFAYVSYGILLQSLGKYDDAIYNYNIAHNLNPNYDLPYINLASLNLELFEKTGDVLYLLLITDYCNKTIRINPRNAQAYYFTSVIKFYENNIEEAIQIMQKSININPYSSRAHYQLAMYYLVKKDYESAKQFLTSSLEIQEEKLVRLNLGAVESFLNNYNAAYYNYQLILGEDPKYFSALINISSACIKLDNHLEALEWVEKIYEYYGNQTFNEDTQEQLYTQLGLIMSALGFYDYAISAYEKALIYSNEQKKALNYFCLANVYFDNEKYDEALETYQIAKSADKNNRLNKLIVDNIKDTKKKISEKENSSQPILETVIPKKTILNNINELNELLNSQAKIIESSNKSFNKTILGNNLYSSTIHENLVKYKGYEVVKDFTDGKWYKIKNNTYNFGTIHRKIASGEIFYDFVVLEENNACKLFIGNNGHYHLSRRKPVVYAGKVSFKDGEILNWSNLSGHYKPPHFEAPKISELTGLPLNKFRPKAYLESRLVKVLEELKLKKSNDNLKKVTERFTHITIGDITPLNITTEMKRTTRNLLNEIERGK